MSLQIWLPLTKDLRQQGVSSVTVTNNGATFNSAGKLGGCYKTSSTATIDLGYDGNQVNSGSLSFGGWFKFNKTELWSVMSSYNYTSTRTTPTGNLIGNNSYGGVSLQWYTNNIYNDSNLTTLYVQGYLRSTTNGARATSGVSLPFDTWVHIFFTFDKPSKVMTVWLNGEAKYTFTNLEFTDAVSRNLLVNYSAVAGGNGPSFNIPFLINDVRIYDHCLSSMEVKKLSQGLVLHYPLNRQGFGQENLLKGTDTLAITGNINTGVGGWDNVSTLTETADGIKLTGRSGSPCFGIPLAIPGSINNNEPYTLSFKYRTNKAVGCNFYYIESSGSNISIYNSAVTEVSTTEWKDYTWTITNSTVANRTPRAILLFYAFSSSSSDWIEIKRGSVKLEKGSITTPWCPSFSDAFATTVGLNGTTEYDTSGYCGNGTRIGTFSWTSDTPKYLVSTTFSGSQYILADSPSSEGVTLALWVKTTSISNGAIAVDYKSKLGFGFYGGVIIPSCNSAIKTTYPITNYNINQWNHIVVVRNNSSSIQLYINGVLQTAASNQDYWSGGVIDGLSVAARPNGSNPIACQVSDLRIYATVLSAEDVKQLYNSNRL